MSTAKTPRFEDLVAEAASWRALGVLFERPRESWSDELLLLSAELTDPTIAAVARRAADEGFEAHYLAILGPGGSVSPREIAYRRMGDPGHLLASLGIVYQAFGYAPKTEEPPDHVSVEAGFVGYLRLKEAFALAGGDLEHAALVRQAANLFVAEHLAYLAVGLRDRLEIVQESYLDEGADQLRAALDPVAQHVVDTVRNEPLGDVFDACLGGCSFQGESSDGGR